MKYMINAPLKNQHFILNLVLNKYPLLFEQVAKDIPFWTIF